MKDKQRIERLELLVSSLAINLAVIVDVINGESKVFVSNEFDKAVKRDVKDATKILRLKAKK